MCKLLAFHAIKKKCFCNFLLDFEHFLHIFCLQIFQAQSFASAIFQTISISDHLQAYGLDSQPYRLDSQPSSSQYSPVSSPYGGLDTNKYVGGPRRVSTWLLTSLPLIFLLVLPPYTSICTSLRHGALSTCELCHGTITVLLVN